METESDFRKTVIILTEKSSAVLARALESYTVGQSATKWMNNLKMKIE